MKKILFAIAIVITMGMTANAQRDAFFTWNDASDDNSRYTGNGVNFDLPTQHGDTGDQTTPLGTGLLIMTALGAGYAVAKRRKE